MRSEPGSVKLDCGRVNGTYVSARDAALRLGEPSMRKKMNEASVQGKLMMTRLLILALPAMILSARGPATVAGEVSRKTRDEVSAAKKQGQRIVARLDLKAFLETNKMAEEDKDRSHSVPGYRVFRIGAAAEYRFLDGTLIRESHVEEVPQPQIRDKVYVAQIGLGLPNRWVFGAKDKKIVGPSNVIQHRSYVFGEIDLRIEITVFATDSADRFRFRIDRANMTGLKELQRRLMKE